MAVYSAEQSRRWLPFVRLCRRATAPWAARTPAGFTFNVKAFSLLTHHPTRVAALPADLRPAVRQAGKDTVYLQQADPAAADQAWGRFLAALEPLRRACKLGAILMQFPQRFPISQVSNDYILACAPRVAPRRVCVEWSRVDTRPWNANRRSRARRVLGKLGVSIPRNS